MPVSLQADIAIIAIDIAHFSPRLILLILLTYCQLAAIIADTPHIDRLSLSLIAFATASFRHFAIIAIAIIALIRFR